MKKILGLDLGTTSIGWAFINEASDESNEISSIVRTGVRVVPLSTDEQQNFKRGKTITVNADRTLKRGMRRNLQRYQQRRAAVIRILRKIGFIDDLSILSEEKQDTHTMYALRAKAPNEKLSKVDFARVLLMINKKRGYKSSRKANTQEEGQLIDGMSIAKRLHNENLTPGKLSYKLLKDGKKRLPDYYRSDLLTEFETIWDFQNQYYPNTLTDIHKKAITGLNKTATGQYFEKTIGIERAENKIKNKKLQEYEWRNIAISEQLDITIIAYILTEINNQINQSSGYLGAIGDRSKELFFNDLTVGQYLYNQLKKNPHSSLKNQVFYRQDYMDEFNRIWDEQSKHYPELTDDLKEELSNETIFYQRKLKSQKGLISICELEGKEQEVLVNGIKKKRIIGPRAAPRSSPVFQQCKIWQNINAIDLKNKQTKETIAIDHEVKEILFEELNLVENLSDKGLLSLLTKISDIQGKNCEVNFKKIEGNKTQATLFKVYQEILEIEGYNNINYKKTASETLKTLSLCFKEIGINPAILSLDLTLSGNKFDKQPAYELWHLLYSYEEDMSTIGTESLINALQKKFGFKEEHALLLSNVTFLEDYGNISVRALRKIYPYLEEGKLFSDACLWAGYNHSKSLTKEQNEARKLDDKLDILKKNSLRNPVVEKILNQMINVINVIMEHPEMGRPDEIRIELARELKKTAKQRKEMTSEIAKATKIHEEYRARIKSEFGLPYVSRKDLTKYKLYLELKSIGFKTLYSGTYIKPEELFTNKFDIEHIIPQSVLYDDSFSNKTIELRDVNLEKGNETAYDYCERKGWLQDYESRVQEVFDQKGIKYGKRKKLYTKKEEIPSDFLNRDMNNSAYIAKKALEIVNKITRNVYATSGKITDKLRSDWELINVLQELNWDKYQKIGQTYYDYNKNGTALPRIKDWTKRNDHRHHAMDAITVAFTKPAFINYLNNKSGENDKNSSHFGIKEKYTYRDKDQGKRKFRKPFENIREETKKHLSEILISHKAKNKVVTLNKNKIKIKGGYNTKTELTPRGQLHKETIYGKSHYYEITEEKIDASFNEEKIALVTNPIYRSALLQRLQDNNNDPKKAFIGKNALVKKPIFIESSDKNIPDKVKIQRIKNQFTIRKKITPDLKVDKVIDIGIRRILKKRLEAFNNNPKEAFVNLDERPIWLNKEKGISIKRVTVTGVSNAEPLHLAKDHNGHVITDSYNKYIPVDYISPGSNHHVAIFQDSLGNLDDESVSFYEAVIRRNQGVPIISQRNEKGWPLFFTLKQNEMFLFPSEDFKPKEIELTDPKYRNQISKHLFRVQKISKVTYDKTSVRDYVFRHHLETEVKESKELKDITWKPIKSLGYLKGIVKVRINHLGEIVNIGEY